MKDLRSFKSLEPSLGRFMIFPDSVDLKDLASQDTDLVSSDDYKSAFLGFYVVSWEPFILPPTYHIQNPKSDLQNPPTNENIPRKVWSNQTKTVLFSAFIGFPVTSQNAQTEKTFKSKSKIQIPNGHNSKLTVTTSAVLGQVWDSECIKWSWTICTEIHYTSLALQMNTSSPCKVKPLITIIY